LGSDASFASEPQPAALVERIVLSFVVEAERGGEVVHNRLHTDGRLDSNIHDQCRGLMTRLGEKHCATTVHSWHAISRR
jgi:hypothetical protein